MQTLSKDLLLEKMIDLCDYGKKLIEKELLFKLKAIWINGFYAPGQGSFPAYAGGKYTLDDGTTRMIVSRGLARESTPIPRFYNRPEFVMIEITPL